MLWLILPNLSLNGPELIQLALSILNFDFEGEQKTVEANLKAIVEKIRQSGFGNRQGSLYIW